MPENSDPIDYRSLMEKALQKLELMQAKLAAKTEAIAVIGMACRFPGGVDNPAAYWELLQSGGDAITEIPLDRWDADAYYDPNLEAQGKMISRYGGFVPNAEQFDPAFFGISPREAVTLDPQHRFLLEVGWEALENSGIVPKQLAGSQTGVFVGLCSNDNFQRLLKRDTREIDAYLATGNSHSTATGRLSYLWGLKGPSLAIDTACSSSLVTVHLACASLRNQECNLALAGGVNRLLLPEVSINFSQAQMLSPEGRCKTFDASADGFVRSEGCGMVVLKRLSDAIADKDQILAVIRGSAINQDGHSSGLTVPNGPSQQAVIRQALENSGVSPAEVSYIEAHGTGTSLGDPLEIGALGGVFADSHDKNHPLIIGSAKTNIGHLEGAAGIAGVIKVVLQLQHQTITPHLHFQEPSPYIPWDELPFKVPTQLMPWQPRAEKRLAGVSSFGFSGTNAHIILEEAPELIAKTDEPKPERSHHLLTLSAKTETALAQLTQRYHQYLVDNPTISLADLCFTANTARSSFDYRLVAIASSTEELQQKLQQSPHNLLESSTSTPIKGEVAATQPKLALLFTGQGSQYQDMGRVLYDTQPTFRASMDRCAEILDPLLDQPLLDILYSQSAPVDPSTLDQTAYTQPALFALEYSLYQLWRSWGIQPTVVMGHSIGEYVAACVAGVFSLQEGLQLIAARGRLMQALPQEGGMVALMASEAVVSKAIAPYAQQVVIAAINGPQNVVISGNRETLQNLTNTFESEGIKVRFLKVSHAFHSPLMQPMLRDFSQVAQKIQFRQPQIKLVSNLTGQWVTSEIATADYWVNHVCQPVRFADSMTTLGKIGTNILLEIGAKPILLGMGRHCWPESDAIWLPSLRPEQSDWQQLLTSLAILYLRGVPINWSGFEQDYSRQRLPLPTYPFQRQRYWAEAKNNGNRSISSSSQPLHPLLAQKAQSPLVKEILFESEFSIHEPPYLDHHRVYDDVVVPAASHVSMLLASAALVFDSPSCELSEILFSQALVIPETKSLKVQLVLTPQGKSEAGFQLISLPDNQQTSDPAWSVHATGKVLDFTGNASAKESISVIQQRCQQTIESTAFYQALSNRQVHLGPSFQGLEQIWAGQNEALGQIRLPESLGGVEQYQLHPCLIDACFQLLAATQEISGDETYIPFRLEKFRFYGCEKSSQRQVWSHVRLRSPKTPDTVQQAADLSIFAQNGEIIAEVEGLEFRKASPEILSFLAKQPVNKGQYEVVWQEKDLESVSPSSQKGFSGYWLLFADPKNIAVELSQQLQQQGAECILVYPGQVYEKVSPNHYQIDPSQAEDFVRLLKESDGDYPFPYRGIIHCWSLEDKLDDDITLDSLNQNIVHHTRSLLYLVQALAKAGLNTSPPLWILTQKAQAVGNIEDEIPLQIQQTPIWGLGRVVALEHPEFHPVLVDLDSNFDSLALQALMGELGSASPETLLAYRQGSRYVARLMPTVLSTPQKPLLISDHCSYLIVGGLGSLGIQTANWLIEQGARYLILMGRSQPSDEVKAVISQWEQRGIDVFIVQGDVCDQVTVNQLFATVKASMPPLRGIIQAAGVLKDGVLLQQTWADFSEAIGPKIFGSWNLHQSSQNLSLDFFVSYSSIAALLGSPGQGNYAAANSFLDSLAHYRQQKGQPGLSINWGPWQGTGMANPLNHSALQRWQTVGIEAIEPVQGIEQLGGLLGRSVTQMAIFSVDWSKFKQQVAPGSTLTFLDAISDVTESDQTQSSASRTSEFWQQLEATATDSRLNYLETYLRTEIAKVLQWESWEQVGLRQRLFDMGLDSLMAVELRNHLHQTLGRTLPATLVFDYPTVEALTQYLATEVLSLETAVIDSDSVEDDELADLLETIDTLSEDEVKQQFAGGSSGLPNA